MGVRLAAEPSVSAPSESRRNARFEPDPLIEAYKKDLDRSLLRENLRRTPEERLLDLVALQRLAAEARRAGLALRRSRR